MANNNRLTPEEVRQNIPGAQPAAQQPMSVPGTVQQPGAMTNPNGFQAVSPISTGTGVPQSAAWRNVQATGNAKTDYSAILGAQPGAYQSAYQPQIGQTMNNLIQQRPYQYDVNTDALYQNIKDNYIRQGRQAMMDTQGASAALTGGYGNSYGLLAGQQAYQNSLGNLSAQIPELYNLAYQRYLGNENSQRQNLAALQGLDESEYQRYQYDTQQYESKLADAYQKYKAATSGGGSGKKKLTYDKYKEYVMDTVNWALDTNGDVSEYVKQGVALGVIPEDVGNSLVSAANVYIDAQRAQAEADEILAAAPMKKED